jgi:hypothetical protein
MVRLFCPLRNILRKELQNSDGMPSSIGGSSEEDIESLEPKEGVML